MLRAAELMAFLAPAAAFVLWRMAVARGMSGPPPRQLAAVAAALALLGAALFWFSAEDALPPGTYVPAAWVDGKLMPGHTE